MSRHHFETTHDGKPVEVIMGYDRPLNYYHLTIIRLAPDETQAPKDDNEILYCNLDDNRAGFCRNLDYYHRVLEELGITVPRTLFVETLNDSQQRIGNREVWHSADGSMKQTDP